MIVSPASSTPRPAAPEAQCSTALPGKCPPHCTSVTPGSTSKTPDQSRTGSSASARSQATSSTGTRISAPNDRAHEAIAP